MESEVSELSKADSYEEFKKLRHAEPSEEVAAEPAAEKVTQPEEGKTESAEEPVTSETRIQESEPVEKSVDDQIRELRAKGKHAAANKLMADEAARPHREEAEKLRKELEGLRTRPADAKPEATAPKPEATAKPVIDPKDPEPDPLDAKYEGENGYTKYLRDDARWAIRQELRETERLKQQNAGREKTEKIMAEGRKAKADFDSVVARVAINDGVLREGIDRLPNLGDVLYKVGSDLTELARIKSLSPIDQWAELVFVSRQLTATPATPLGPVAAPERLKPAVSRVTAPPRILSGSDTPEPKSTREARDYEDFKRIRRAS